MLLQNCNELSGKIPVSGMDSLTHGFVFALFVPFIVSILTALFFARFISPLFLRIKNKALAHKYTTAYFKRKPQPYDKKTLIKRLLFTILLAFGFLSFVFGTVQPENWISPEDKCSYEERGLDYQYHVDLFLPMFGIVYPIAVGLWAISWALEDSGLMHYVFRDNDYFDIEPVYVRYNTYVKGYAGIGALLFAVEWPLEQLNNSATDALFIFAALLISIGCFFPAYIVYVKVLKDHKYLIGGMTEMKKLTEEDLK